MASDTGVPNDKLDERLAAARDGALQEGEKVVAQEEGDQGQAIVLTNSRVLVLKAGITATGTPNGKIVGAFPIAEIAAVNVRKGPLGAVIQICVEGKEPPAPGSAPDNVVVFTGSQRMKKCDSIAARIESALGKPVGRVESHEVEPAISDVAKGGRAPQSLAEEIFAELTQAQSRAEQRPEQPAREPEPAGMAAVATDTPAAGQEPPALHPNPQLPKPVRARRAGDKVLVLLGLLIAALVIGVAAMAPLRVAEQTPTIDVSWSELTRNTKLARRQLDAVAQYEAQLQKALESADRAMAAFESALRSGNKAAVARAVRGNAVDSAWRRLDAVKPPPGLAGAKGQVTSGLFVGKTAIANLSGALQSSAPLISKDVLARIAEARALIRKGLLSIAGMRTQLEKQLRKTGGPAPCLRSGARVNNTS